MRRVHEAGVTRACLPERLGGSSLSPADWVGAVSVLAAGNAAVGWVAGHSANTNYLLASCGTGAQAERLLADPYLQIAGSTAGMGKATAVAGGWEIEGRWGFESGVSCSTHAGGLARVVDPGAGQPEYLFVFPEVGNVVVDSDWDSVGLAGTGSHSIEVRNQVIDHDLAIPFPMPLDRPVSCTDPIACAARGPWAVAAASAATQMGVADRAVNELEHLARAKVRPGSGVPQIEEQSTIRGLESMRGRHQAAQAGLRYAMDEMWAAAYEGRPITLEMRVAVRRACATAVELSVGIVRQCVDLAGAGAIGRSHPIARCHRDGTILHQHQSSNDYSREMVGRTALGLGPDSPGI